MPGTWLDLHPQPLADQLPGGTHVVKLVDLQAIEVSHITRKRQPPPVEQIFQAPAVGQQSRRPGIADPIDRQTGQRTGTGKEELDLLELSLTPPASPTGITLVVGTLGGHTVENSIPEGLVVITGETNLL